METGTLAIEEQYGRMGNLLCKEKKYTQAIPLYEKAIAANPQYGVGYVNMASAYVMLEDYDKARELYHSAIQIDEKGSGIVYYYLGNVEIRQGNTAGAKAFYDKAIGIGYESSELYFNYSNLCLKEKDFAGALAGVNRAIGDEPDQIDYSILKTQILMLDRQLDGALACAQGLLDRYPANWAGYHYKALILIGMDAVPEALEIIRQGKKLFPGMIEFSIDQMLLLKKQKKYAEAVQVIDTELQGLRSYELLFEKAKMLLAVSRPEQAIPLLDEVRQHSAGQKDVFMSTLILINICIADGRLEEALNLSREMKMRVDLDPSFYAGCLFVPWYMELMGKTEEAQAEYQSALADLEAASRKMPARLELYLYIALCYKGLGSYEKAMDVCDFVLEIKEDSPEAFLVKAEVCHALGDAENEKKFRQMAISGSSFISTVLKGSL